jgi:hypothetical protein
MPTSVVISQLHYVASKIVMYQLTHAPLTGCATAFFKLSSSNGAGEKEIYRGCNFELSSSNGASEEIYKGCNEV